MPSVPDHLADDAKVEWGRVCGDLYGAGLLSRVDRAILALYCQAWARWLAAERALAAEGLTIATTNGNIVQNPLVGVARRAMLDVARYAVELGMTPSARSRVTARPPTDTADDPGAKYFERGLT